MLTAFQINNFWVDIDMATKKRDCQIYGDEHAVGKYFVDPSESESHGWWRVCSFCAETVENVGTQVDYYKYSMEYRNRSGIINELPEKVINCHHKWDKWSLVSEVDKRSDMPFDWMRCEKCQCYGKRFSLNQIDMDDLMMSIDLNCSK